MSDSNIEKIITGSILAPILVGIVWLFVGLITDVATLKANEASISDKISEIKTDVKEIKKYLIGDKK